MPALKILSIPGRHHENRFFQLFLGGLEGSGAQIVNPRLSSLIAFDFDVLCLNFPTHHITESGPVKAVASSFAFGVYLLLTRLLGRKLIYVVHDVEPIKRRNEFVLWRFLAFVHALTQGYIFISKSSRRAFMAKYPGQESKPAIVVPHGPYPTTRLTTEARATLRRSLVGDDDTFLVGFLGNIKPYKNAAALHAVPSALSSGRPVRTLIAGRIEVGYEKEIQAIFDSLPAEQVIRLDVALDDAELDALIQVVDVVLMPYLRGSNSGVALLVLANQGRLIGSGLPILKELAADVGLPWVRIAESTEGLTSAIEEAAMSGVGEDDRRYLLAYLDQVSFETGARRVHVFCQQLLRREHGAVMKDAL